MGLPLKKKRRGPQVNTGAHRLHVSWRWAHGTDPSCRELARRAIGGWLESIGFPVFGWTAIGRWERIIVTADADILSSARAIASFIAHTLGPYELDGPIRSGVATSRGVAHAGA